METVPPFLAAGLRFLIATLILRLIMLIRRERIPLEPDFWLLVAEMGLLTYTLPFACIYWGQKQIATGLSSILFATFPFWVAICSHVRLETEKMNLPRFLGVLIGFAGVTLIFSRQLLHGVGHSFLGMAAIVVGALSQAFALVSVKRFGAKYSSISINFAGMVIGAIILLTASLAVEDFTDLEFDSKALIPLLYLSTIGTVFTYVLYFWLAKQVNAVLLSFTAFVTPIIAVGLGAIVLDERLGRFTLWGSALVLGGILVGNVPGLWRYIQEHRAATGIETP